MDFSLVTHNEICYQVVQSNSEFVRLVYYSHLPTIIVALAMGVFVFLSNKGLMGKLLLAITGVFSVWSILDLFAWISYDTGIIMFVWALLGIFDMLIFSFSLYFSYVFLDKKDISSWKKLIIFIPIIPIIILTATQFDLKGFNAVMCEAVENFWFFTYYHFFGLFILLWIIILAFAPYRKASTRNEKMQVILFSLGMECFLISFFFAGYLASLLDNYNIGIYGLFGMPIFIGFLSLLIVRYKAFNVRLLGAQALIIAMTILIGSQFFFIKSYINGVLTAITFVLVIGFGYILIRSIKQELERKEELQMMANRLSQANDRLKKLDRAKSDFISIASHQLRTPLTAIKGFISLILEGSYGSVTGDVQNALNKVYLSNERLIHLVEDLLNISRIESGKLQFRMEECDITELLRDVVDMFVLRAKEKGLKLTLDIPSDTLPLIMTDGQKIREVVSNLIDNAIKYSETGEVKIQAISGDKGVRISVKDTGMGIEPEDLPYLFQKFSRGKDIGRVHANGTGLGLYVGKNLMEALGGSIGVESEGPGKGSIFSIELPLRLPNTMPRRTEQQVFDQV